MPRGVLMCQGGPIVPRGSHCIKGVPLCQGVFPCIHCSRVQLPHALPHSSPFYRISVPTPVGYMELGAQGAGRFNAFTQNLSFLSSYFGVFLLKLSLDLYHRTTHFHRCPVCYSHSVTTKRMDYFQGSSITQITHGNCF